MLKLAVFDLDGTLLIDTSAEAQLLRFLCKQHLIKPYHVFHTAVSFFRLMTDGITLSIRSNKSYLRGMSVEKFEQILPSFYDLYLRPRLSKMVVERMAILKSQNFRIVILSGTLQMILDYLRNLLPMDEGVGSIMEIKDGIYTGRMVGLHPYGRDKIAVLENHFAGQPVDYTASFAFADRTSDIPLLERFGHPVATYPKRRLRRIAFERNWEILE